MLTVDRRDLLNVLRVMAKVRVKSRPQAVSASRGRRRARSAATVPILSYVKIVATDRSLTITANDLDNEVVATIKAKNGRKWVSTAPFDALAQIVSGTSSERIAFDAENSDLTVTCDESVFTLKALPASDFPDHREFDRPHSFEMTAADLAEAISHVVFAVSKEETRYYLNGIYLESLTVGRKPTLRLVATDGHRLASFDMRRPTGAAKMPGVIVPRKAISILEAMLKRAGAVTVKVGTLGIEVSAGSITLFSKLIDGTYPEYQRVIPKDLVRSATMSAPAIMAACRRLRAFTAERGRALRLAFGPTTGLTVSVKGDFGTATATISAALEGEPVTVGINASYLTEALARLGAGEAAIDFDVEGSGGGPVRIRTPDKPQYQVIQMPMRV